MVIHAHDVELQKQWFRARLASEKSKHDVVKMIKEGQGDFVLLDARDLAAWERGHIPGALSMPLAEVEQGLGDFDRDREHVVYCWNVT